MKKNINILMLGAGKRVSLCERLIASGKSMGIEVSLFAYELDNLVPIASLATIVVGLRWSSPEISNHVVDVIKKYNIDLVLPLMDEGTVFLSKIKPLIASEKPETWACVSSPDICACFLDKKLSEAWFLENNVPVPRLKDGPTFPMLAKSRLGYGSRGIHHLQSREALAAFERDHVATSYLYQPIITGQEYTIDAYVTRTGKILGCVTRQRWEMLGGEVNKGKTLREDALINECHRILSIGGFEGPITLQAIKSQSDGEFYFIEINPRFGGGVIHSLQAGARFDLAVISEAAGVEPPNCDSWQENLVMMRANREFFTYANNN